MSTTACIPCDAGVDIWHQMQAKEMLFGPAAHLLMFECWVEHISDDLQRPILYFIPIWQAVYL